MPTSVLTLGNADSNYDELVENLKKRLDDPDPRGLAWQLSGKSGAPVNNLTVQNLKYNVNIGKAKGNQSKFNNLNFRIYEMDPTANREINFERADIRNSNFSSSGVGKEELNFGGRSDVRRVSASLGDNDDIIEFFDGAKSKVGFYKTGSGKDSVFFNAKSRSDDDTIDVGVGEDSIKFFLGAKVDDVIVSLGDDTDRDIVEIETDGRGRDKVSGVINEFGDDDILKIGSSTFTADDIRKRYNDGGDFGDIRINLQNP